VRTIVRGSHCGEASLRRPIGPGESRAALEADDRCGLRCSHGCVSAIRLPERLNALVGVLGYRTHASKYPRIAGSRTETARGFDPQSALSYERRHPEGTGAPAPAKPGLTAWIRRTFSTTERTSRRITSSEWGIAGNWPNLAQDFPDLIPHERSAGLQTRQGFDRDPSWTQGFPVGGTAPFKGSHNGEINGVSRHVPPGHLRHRSQ
jgi:hypothetical protein